MSVRLNLLQLCQMQCTGQAQRATLTLTSSSSVLLLARASQRFGFPALPSLPSPSSPSAPSASASASDSDPESASEPLPFAAAAG